MAGKRTIALVPATAEHAWLVSRQMRAADVDEVMASGGFLPLTACAESVQASREATAVLVDGAPRAIYGVCGDPGAQSTGVVWLLATAGFPWGLTAEFMAGARAQVAVWLTEYRALANWVDARNLPSIRWLRRLGACFGAPEPRGPQGRPFVPFCIGRM